MTTTDYQPLHVFCETARMAGKTIALVNGCFDLLHVGHVGLFQLAAKEADTVVVAIDGDARVRALKGECRPIFPLAQRMAVVAAMEAVDFVASFETLDEYQRLFRMVAPDVLVKGEDYRDKPIVGWRDVPRVVFNSATGSSSEIIRRLEELAIS